MRMVPRTTPLQGANLIDCIPLKSRTMRFEMRRQKQTRLFSQWLPREGRRAQCVAGKEPHETARVTRLRLACSRLSRSFQTKPALLP